MAGEQHNPHAGLSDAAWRQTMRTVAGGLLALPEGAACPAHPVANFLGERAVSGARPVDLKKTEFYASATPAIDEVAKLTLTGEGLETRFRPEMFALEYSKDTAAKMPFTTFMTGTVYGMEFFVNENASERYRIFADGAMQHKYHRFLYSSAIARGCHPQEINHFGLVTIPLIKEHALTRRKSPEQRRRVAHELSSVLMGRAMQNITNLALRPNLDSMVGKVDMHVRGGQHRLIDAATRKPLPVGHNLAAPVGPTLKCPAHDYLPRFIAAGVNLIADAGYYGRPAGNVFVNWVRDKLGRS